MAVFTAIASAIVGAITGAGFMATFAGFLAGTLSIGATIGVALTAAGLGLATAKATGLFKPPGFQQAKDPGVKVQLAPSTDNRVPVFYGKVHTGAVMVDAAIKNKNNTMQYVMVIGEKTDSGTFSLQSLKRGDTTINFAATGNACTGQTDPNATATTSVAGKMRLNVYAGNAQNANNQIFPSSPKVTAQSIVPTINANTNYEDLVYAIFEMDYDVENGLQQLGQLTFEITNSLHEPSNVLLDYLKNDRYGAGLTNDDLVLDSFNDMFDYSNINGTFGNVEFRNAANVSSQHSRWQIDGMLSTYQPVKQNIDFICQSAATFFTYDNKSGKFKVVPNRALTTAEKANCFVFNDDNITSKITISSTELYSQYNSIEAEHPSVEQNDQTDVIIVSTPAGDRNSNEPDNVLQTRYELVNDGPRVHNLANIDLRQSRLSTTIEFEADYSALQVDVGDVVKVNNSNFGYSDKLFRVMRVAEQETAEGMLNAKIVGLEYDDSVYTHNVIQTDAALNIPNIPGWWTGIWGNTDIANISNIIGNINIVDDPLSNVANVVDPPTGNIVGNIDIANIDLGIGGEGGIGSGFGMLPSINFPITIPEIPDISEILVNVDMIGSSENSNVANTMQGTTTPVTPPGNNTTFTPGEVIDITIPTPKLPLVDQGFTVGPILGDVLANIDVSMINYSGIKTATATAPNITLAPKGKIERVDLGSVQAGIQVEEEGANGNMTNSTLANTDIGTVNALITPNTIIDAGAIDEGEFSAVNNMVPFGKATNNTSLAYQPFRVVKYKAVDIDADGKMTANTTITNVQETVLGSGTKTNFITSMDDNFKYEVSRARGSAIANAVIGIPASANLAYIPANITVGNWGNTNLDNVNVSAGRRMEVTNSDKRISKSDTYLDIGGFF